MQYTLSAINGLLLANVDAETFHRLVETKKCLQAWLQVEEVFGYVVDAWCDMETQIHARSLRSHDCAANPVMHRARFFDDRAIADRLLLSFLSATRMYLDHLKTQVPLVVGDSHALASSIASIRNAYRGRSPLFVVADTLRNIVQHEAYGVERITYGDTLLSKPTAFTRVGTSLSLPMSDLSPVIRKMDEEITSAVRNKRGSASAREERLRHELEMVKQIPLPIELRTTMRHFCADLAEMQEEVREGVRQHLEEAIDVFAEAYSGEPISSQGERGVFARAIDADGSCSLEEWIGHAAVERLVSLRERNSGWQHIRDRAHSAPMGTL
jgi:hypothetical protein